MQLESIQTRRSRRTRAAFRSTSGMMLSAVLAAAMLLALPAAARNHGEHGERGGWGGSGKWITQHAEQLGIDDATLAEINGIVDASREKARLIYAEHRAARDAMHQLLDQDAPDRAAVMKQADVIGEIELRKHKHRLSTMLEIHARLTPAQRAQLREMRSKMKGEMRERRGKHGKHGEHGEHGEREIRGERRRGEAKTADDAPMTD